MPVSEFHKQVTSIALGGSAPPGFALGGGNALVAHGVIDRPTQDVDVFSDEQGGVEAAAGAVEAALREAGLRTERRDSGGLADIFDGMGEGLAEWLVTGPGGEQMMLQMAYFDRARKPVIMDIGPVLDLEDVIGGKVCALASRAEPRDYVDTAAALDRYSVAQMISFARRLDPGLTDRDFADAGGGWTSGVPGCSLRSGSARGTLCGCGNDSRPGRGADLARIAPEISARAPGQLIAEVHNLLPAPGRGAAEHLATQVLLEGRGEITQGRTGQDRGGEQEAGQRAGRPVVSGEKTVRADDVEPGLL